MNSTPILTAVEEVCLGTIGTIRTVSAGSLQRDAYDGQSDEARAIAARINARVEVEVISVQRTGVVAPEIANRAVLDIELRLTFAFTTEFELRDDQRLATRAAAIDLMQRCRDALCWPGNLRQTQAGVPTNLIGHSLRVQTPIAVRRVDFKKRIFEAEMRATGLIDATLAVA